MRIPTSSELAVAVRGARVNDSGENTNSVLLRQIRPGVLVQRLLELISERAHRRDHAVDELALLVLLLMDGRWWRGQKS